MQLLSITLCTAFLVQTNFLSICTQNATQTRVLGGTETTISKHPWLVVMIRPGNLYCGGAIIGKSWIVSAAHCLEEKPSASVLKYRAGSSDRATGGQLVGVEWYKIHPFYGHKDYIAFAFDVVLVRTNVEFNFTSAGAGPFVSKIPLPKINWEPQDGSYVTVSGWGRTGFLGFFFPTTKLHEATFPVINRRKCNENEWVNRIDESMICAGENGKSGCSGDSGSALTQHGVLVGVVSWGALICISNRPEVYARISHPKILEWIYSTVGSTNSTASQIESNKTLPVVFPKN